MRGLVAAETEVAGCSDDALTEVMMPETVHKHTAGERIVGVGDPLGQRAAALTFRHGVRAEIHAGVFGPGKSTGLHFLLRVFGITAPLHLDHGRLGLSHDGIDFGRFGQSFERGVEFDGLRPQLFQLLLLGSAEPAVLHLRDETSIAEEQQVAADAIAAIRGDECESFCCRRNGNVQVCELVLAHFELLKLELIIHIHSEVRA